MFKQVAFVFFCFVWFQASAQKQYNVLDWKADQSLNTYLVQQMHEQYDQRRMLLKTAMKSKETALSYIKSVKQKAKEVIGKLPKKAPLNPRITGEIKQDGYRIEKIVYQSFENHHVTANLYVPNGSGKFPAVLLFCGHEDLSKATESYQKMAILLAKHGFVVFVIDPISQSERVQLTDEHGKSLTRGATTEHTLLNLGANLLGTSVAAYELLDNQCGLDYLLTRKEVEGSKVGVIGNSGGGMQTIYFAAIDDRVKVIVPCSYLASRELTLATTGAADGCAQIPNEGAQLLEMSDYLIAAAPKPILILAGRYDFIDYNGTRQSFDDLNQVYRKLDAANKLSLFTYDDGHGISKPKRERAVQWLRKWFYHDNRPIVEPDLKMLTDTQLFATDEAKVSLSYPTENTVQDYNQKLFANYTSNRARFMSLPLIDKRSEVRRLLHTNSDSNEIFVETLGKVKGKFATFQKIILRTEKEMPLPVLMYYPEKAIRKVVVWVGDEGKNKWVDSLGLMQAYLDQGDVAVVFADLRGTGETADKPELNDPKYFNRDYRNAMLALHIGKPLLGQRVKDVETILRWISATAETRQSQVVVNAKGNVGLSAIYAAFLGANIASINLYDCIASYQQLLAQPLAKDRYGLVLHNQLYHFDIPDLLKSTAVPVKFYNSK